MINYKKLLQESKDMKWEAIHNKKDTQSNPYSCNYSPVSHHKYCEHDHCIFDKEWQDKDKQTTLLLNQIKAEEDFLKNGEGCKGYDFQTVYKNVLRLKNKLKKL